MFKLKDFILNKTYIYYKIKFINIKNFLYLYKIYNNIIILDILKIKLYIINVFYYLYLITKLNKNILVINTLKLFKNLIKKFCLITTNYYLLKNKYDFINNFLKYKNKILLLKWFNIYIIKNKLNLNKNILKILKYIKINNFKNIKIPKTIFILNFLYNKKQFKEFYNYNFNIITFSNIYINGIKYIILGNNFNILSVNFILQILTISILYNRV